MAGRAGPGREEPEGSLAVCALDLGDPRVRDVWLRLQEAGGVPTPFLSWEWFSAMADVDELAGRVKVVAAFDDETAVGLLPLECDDGGPGGLRTVGVAGWRWLTPDHVDVVAEPTRATAVAAAIVGHVAARRDWDLLDFDGLVARGAVAEALRGMHRPGRLFRRPEEDCPAPYLQIRPGAKLGSPSLRKGIRRDVNKAERSGGGFFEARSEQDVAAFMEDVIRLHVEQWGDESAVFATDARRRFHRLAATRLAATGHARCYRLVFGDETAAAHYALVWGATLYLYVAGRREGMGKSPATACDGLAVMGAIEEGFGEVDLCRGTHPWKLRFTDTVRHDVRARIVRASPRSAAAALRGALRRMRAGRRRERPGATPELP